MSGDRQEQQRQTYGERLAGVGFNPSGDPDVAQIKRLYAEIINFCHGQAKDDSERSRLFKLAIDAALTGQMMAVKAITWRDEDG